MRDAVAATGLAFKELDEGLAVFHGSLSAVQRLQRRGVLSRREPLCQVLARGGHLEKLKVLCDIGLPWDEKPCSDAAYGGHIEVLQWVRANGCPWSEWSFAYAAYGGHLEMKQLVHATGCPWDAATRRIAEGHVLEWAIANGVPE
tara:strand:+ start:1643 stop:2077 length:435 start_codon:yes stop_codon:yes gene_type:complete